MSRRRFTEIEVIETLLHQGVAITCFRCGEPFTLADSTTGNIQKEHLHERELDGPDIPANCRFSHDDCHKIITFGNGATTAGSSIHRIAKTKRIERTGKMAVNKPPLEGPRKPKRPYRWASRPMRSHKPKPTNEEII